ncbi:hypothetical protein ACFFRR_003304 [Megaselia abdita]
MKIANCILMLFAFMLLNGARDQEVEGAWVSGMMTAFKIVNQIVKLLEKLEVIPNNEVKDQLECINEICSKLDEIQYTLDASTEKIIDAIYSLKNFISMEIEMNDVRNWMNNVELQYQRMELMAQNHDEYENSTLRAFAEWNAYPGQDSISSKLFNIFFTYFGYQKILTDERLSRIPLVDKIAQEFKYEETHNLCPMISAQQHFYMDYLRMTVVEIRGYLVAKYSFTILREQGLGEYKAEEADAISEHDKRTYHMTEKLRVVISEAGREIRQCDPEEHVLGESYDQLTRVVQGYIVNEVNINHVFTCSDDCKYHVNREVYGCYNKDWYCPQDKGTGKILRCEFDTNKDHVTICPSSNPARRYEYFETNRSKKKNRNFYGQQESCPNNEILVKSWLRGVYQCSYCFCLMDEKSELSDRYFNLREVVSDVDENMVVTGVRFIKENRVFYLQIQQGFLGPMGLIDDSTLEWKELETYELSEDNDGEDYFTVDSDNQSINLDDIETEDPEYLVTGVKFIVLNGHLSLQVQVTKYNFEDGALYESESEWISSTEPHE